MLADQFMHCAFDVRMVCHRPEAPFARQADDAFMHCAAQEEAESINAGLAKRSAECRLEVRAAPAA